MQRKNAPAVDSMSWHLRPMEPHDGAAYLHLMAIGPEAGLIALHRLSQANAYEKLMANRPGHMIVVAEAENGELAGYGSCDLRPVWFKNQAVHALHLHGLIVHPQYRRRGLQQALTQWRISWGRKRYGVNILIFAELPYGSTDAYTRASEWATDFEQTHESGFLHVLTDPPQAAEGVTIRAASADDGPQIVAGLNRFNQDVDFTDYVSPASAEPSPHEQYQHRYVAEKDGQLVAGAVLTLPEIPAGTRHTPSTFIGGLLDHSKHIIMRDQGATSGTVEDIWFAPGAADTAYLLIENMRYIARTQADTLYFSITNPRVWDALHAPNWRPQSLYSIAYLRPRELKYAL